MTFLRTIGVVFALLALFGVGMYFFERTAVEQRSEVKQETPIQLASLIRIDSPAVHESIASPYTFRGEARGIWFFEASFPVRVEDVNGNVLGQSHAEAQGEWMTEDFVSFTGTIEFTSPVDQPGRIIFAKDNPSGLPEHDAEIAVPIEVQKSAVTNVKVFFGNTVHDPNVLHCDRVYPVEHTVPETKAVARAALENLLRGPTPEEKADGYTTAIPNDQPIAINKLVIVNGTAFVDFNEALEYQVGGSCRVLAIRAQIKETLKQFPTVKDVVLSVEGRGEDFILQP